jgi:uncharacterized protein (UPF0261 family)
MSNDVIAGGRKTTVEDAVLVTVNSEEIVFSDEMEAGSVPSLESDEEESDWESEDEEEEVDDEEDAELDEGLAERLRILADARALKNLATAFLHPENPVVTTDGAAFGRNYFDRPSAPERMEDEDADEVAEILEDAMKLKKAARAYLHPEEGVVSDPEVFGRNYFNRASAPEVESLEEANERARILADAAALKKSAADYMHPEVGVKSTDGACFGRNYFNRYSAPETEDDEFADERAEILADALALKKAAVDYLHPEIGVKNVDGACFGRNYFERPSAPEVEDVEEANERAQILADAAALKKSAVNYLHPEIGVSVEDATVFGRNYFNRASAPEMEEDEFADERAEILADALALKKAAIDYMHPEIGVKTTDGACFGRNYFNRYSAPDVESLEDANERAQILADAAALKKSAVNYLHPEIGVSVEDSTVFGRNYFNRASAPETEEDEFADERAEILADAIALKQSAVNYLHPEIGVKTTDATLFGRNYFNRYSAPDVESVEDANERAQILADALALKKSAIGYLHPEIGVSTEDATLFGRNYFGRASAPDMEDPEDANEREQILADALALKKSAIGYLHPEVGVTSADGACFGRNYFNRASAPETEDADDANERAQILADAMALKKSAVDYMHPEIGVSVTDATVFGRNYFTRYSAPSAEVEPKKASPEQQDIAGDLSKLAAAVKGANLPSTKSAKLSSADNDLGAAKKSASNVNLFGLSEEVM